MYPSAHGLPATLGSDAVSVPSSGSPGVELQGVQLQGTAKKPDELGFREVVSSAEADARPRASPKSVGQHLEHDIASQWQ